MQGYMRRRGISDEEPAKEPVTVVVTSNNVDFGQTADVAGYNYIKFTIPSVSCTFHPSSAPAGATAKGYCRPGVKIVDGSGATIKLWNSAFTGNQARELTVSEPFSSHTSNISIFYIKPPTGASGIENIRPSSYPNVTITFSEE